ncbi:MAG: hydroxyacid dehydrogenase, partial [Actinomycetota bacterium]|nr:hydroxyacid dehydrogenase [Actinomycetota bacterium]
MENKKVLVLSPLKPELVKSLFGLFEGEDVLEKIEVKTYEGNTKKELLEHVRWADAILGDYTFKIEMDAEVLRACVPCLLVQQPSTGFNHIDVEEAAKLGIPVANCGTANSSAVAEHTIMLILACL